MAQLVDDGLVRYIGVSNFEADLVKRCEAIRHVDAYQGHFSLLHPATRDELIPFCEHNGTGVLCYGPLGFGLLTGTITRDTQFSPHDWRSGEIPIPVPLYQQIFAPGARERHLAVVEQLRVVAERLGLTLPQLALAWVTHQPGVTGAIVGSRSPNRMRENTPGEAIHLKDEDRAAIEEVITNAYHDIEAHPEHHFARRGRDRLDPDGGMRRRSGQDDLEGRVHRALERDL